MNVNKSNWLQRIFSRRLEKFSPAVWCSLCLGLLLVCGALAYAYVHGNGPLIGSQTKKDALSWLPQFLTFIGALIAAWQFNRKYNQDKEKYQQDKEQNQALREQSQLQFEIKALNDNYTDILDRFSNTDSVAVRANAALRLAEIAQMPLPGKSVDKLPRNYPYFLRASAQLAAALHIETEQPVRTEIVKAVQRMSQFISGGNDFLATQFIHDFADTNRIARTNFVKVLAEFGAITEFVTEDFLGGLIAFTPICGNAATTLICLEEFSQSTEYENFLDICTVKRMAQGDNKLKNPDQALLERVELVASRLIDARDALENALQVTILNSLKLNLHQCFLADATLNGTHLASSQLGDAYLQNAEVRNAVWIRTNMDAAHLQYAVLIDSAFQKCSFVAANMEYATLGSSKLEKANFALAWLKNANFQYTRLDGANFNSANFGSDEDVEHDSASFTCSNWWDIDFKKPGSQDEDRRVRDFFERNKEKFGGSPVPKSEKATEAGN